MIKEIYQWQEITLALRNQPKKKSGKGVILKAELKKKLLTNNRILSHDWI